ncbi:MAG: hypothetical protein ABIJ97_07560 [Bacteroidota bacterium]
MKMSKTILTLVVVFAVFMSKFLNPVADCNRTGIYKNPSNQELTWNISTNITNYKNLSSSNLIRNLMVNAFITNYKILPSSKSPGKSRAVFTYYSDQAKSYKAK